VVKDPRWAKALQQQDLALGTRQWQALIKAYPNTLAPVEGLAQLQARNNQPTLALKTLQGFLSQHPNSEAGMQALGLLHYKLKIGLRPSKFSAS
jgi:predicted Zn-dependent protease